MRLTVAVRPDGNGWAADIEQLAVTGRAATRSEAVSAAAAAAFSALGEDIARVDFRLSAVGARRPIAERAREAIRSTIRDRGFRVGVASLVALLLGIVLGTRAVTAVIARGPLWGLEFEEPTPELIDRYGLRRWYRDGTVYSDAHVGMIVVRVAGANHTESSERRPGDFAYVEEKDLLGLWRVNTSVIFDGPQGHPELSFDEARGHGWSPRRSLATLVPPHAPGWVTDALVFWSGVGIEALLLGLAYLVRRKRSPRLFLAWLVGLAGVLAIADYAAFSILCALGAPLR